MAHRQYEREHHTQLGWWIMTHDRGGSALIGSVALAALAGDTSYVASQWRSASSGIGAGFLLGAATVAVAGLMAAGLGVGKPSGPDRDRARRRSRRNNLILGLIVLVFAGASLQFGSRFAAGVLLGEIAALACLFAVVGLRVAASRRRTRVIR